MRSVVVWLSAAALANLCGGFAFADKSGKGLPLWDLYGSTLSHAKYIDLTHALAPGGPLGEGFVDFRVGPTRAGVSIPGVIEKGEPISDIPPTVALRPLVVINVAPKVARDPGYQAAVADIKDWERRHGPVPAGSVVMIRSDWSKKWNDPKRFTAQPFPGVSLAALKYLHLDRHILMHGHEPLDTDNTAPEFVAEKWLLQHNFAQAEGVANLDQVPEAGALITIGFAKFDGGTGGFARYIAIAPSSWPFEEKPGAPLPTHAHALRRGADGVMRETP
jgi:kynurenine formamidase